VSVGPDGWYACEKDEESCDYDRLWQQMEARCVTEVCYGEQAASGPCELFCNATGWCGWTEPADSSWTDGRCTPTLRL
jgi:hypothetical protein